jgi:hypothetical protein
MIAAMKRLPLRLYTCFWPLNLGVGAALCCMSVAAAAQSQVPRLVDVVDNPTSAGGPSQASTDFDGRWKVTLICDSVSDKRKLVKGYEKHFYVDVKEGRVAGEQGQAGTPGSAVMAGVIQPDGATEIAVKGITGSPDTAVGSAPTGSEYGYTMRGSFSQASGQATRVGVRPCTATFSRS